MSVKKIILIVFLCVLRVLSFAVIFGVVIAGAFLYEPMTVLLPAKTVEQFLLYDHIEYEGTDYYFYESSKMPDGVIPDFDSKINVNIASSTCRDYGKNTICDAYLCQNDPNHMYIYFDSCYFVNDRSLATYPWNDETSD